MQILTWNSAGNKGSSTMAASPPAAVLAAPSPAGVARRNSSKHLSDALQIEMDLWREKDKATPNLGSLSVNTVRSNALRTTQEDNANPALESLKVNVLRSSSDVSDNSTAPGSARTSVSSTQSMTPTQRTPRQDTPPKTPPKTPPATRQEFALEGAAAAESPRKRHDSPPKSLRRRSSKSSVGSQRSATPIDADRKRPSLSSMRPEVGGPMTPPQPSPRKSERRSRFMTLIRGEAEEQQKALVPHHRVVAAIERRQQRFPDSKALSLSSIEKTFEPQKWLTDASINFVYTLFHDCGLDIKNIGLPESMQRKEDAQLPKSILLMDPAIAFWLTIEQDANEVSDAKKKLELGDRRLIACPVNDNWDGGKANGGSHWSLLVGWASTAKGGDFNFVHYDSMAEGHGDDSSSYRHAQQLAERLAGKQVAVSQGACPQQSNGYDCGMYVLMISATVAGAVLTAGKGPLAKQDQPVWEKNFKLMTPAEVTKRRKQYYQMAKADI